MTKSDQTPWYEGPALLSHLEEVYIAGDRNLVDVRFPVQYVIRPQTREHQDHRSYAGTVASGVMRPGDEVVVLPVGKTTRITAIDGPMVRWHEAFPPMAVSISLADEIDISRGDMIARTHNQPRVAQEFDATVCWMADDAALEPGRDYVIKHTTRTTRARVTALDYRLDVNTLHRDKTRNGVEAQRTRPHFAAHPGAAAARRVHPQRQHRVVHPHRPATPTAPWRPAWCCATLRHRPRARTPCGTSHRSSPRTGLGARRCGSPVCPAPASRRWPCWSSKSCSKRALPLTFSTATICGMA